MFTHAEKYTYITGRIRVKETHMLNAVDLDRMINAPSAKESFRVLNDTDFSNNLLELPEGKLEKFQRVLDDELHDVRHFLKLNVPEENIMRYLALKYNFSNLKILLKEKIFNITEDEEMGSMTTVSKDFLEECIDYQPKKVTKKRKTVTLSDLKLVYHLSVKEVMDYYDKHDEAKNPVMIDLILDKHYFAELLRWAKFFGSQFIKDYIVTQIDLHNISTFLRIKRADHRRDILKLSMIDGGKIENDVYFSSIEESLDHFKKELMKTPYWQNLAESWSFYIKNNEFWMLERDVDNILVRMLKKTNSIAYGPEVAFSYLWGKHNAVRNIRIIMLAKINNISPDIIKERIRELY